MFGLLSEPSGCLFSWESPQYKAEEPVGGTAPTVGVRKTVGRKPLLENSIRLASLPPLEGHFFPMFFTCQCYLL